MPRRVRTRPDAARALAASLIHDLAQPLATAALALDIARIVTGRGDLAEAERRVEVAQDSVAQAQALLRACGDAVRGRAEPAPFDVAVLLRDIVQNAHLPAAAPVVADARLLRSALGAILATMDATAVTCIAPTALRPTRQRTLIRMEGKAPRGPAELWMALLRAAGIRVGVRTARTGLAVVQLELQTD